MTAQPPEHPNSPRHYGYGDYEGQPQPPLYAVPAEIMQPVRRKRRRGRVWLIVLIVLAALLVVSDRVAAVVIQDKLAAKIQQSQHLDKKPSVSIGGFPFLTQVVSRNFGHATVDIADFNSGGVPIAHIHADLTGVHVNSGYNSATVDTLVGTATLDFAGVSQVLSNDVANIGHVTLSQGTGNEVTASYSVLDTKVTAQIAVNLLSGNTLEFKTTKVTTALSGLSINTPGFDAKIQLNALPFGMQLSSLQMTSTGMDISATGTNVVLTGTVVRNVG